MNELDAAEAVRDGRLPSPTKFGGMTLWNLRITGTGLSFRSGLDEFVWRDPSIYCNGRFLARCSGLPVIWDHPAGASLNSEEFGRRVIGTVMLPYLKEAEQEAWAVCRVYDDEANELMIEGQLSTSPAVVFRPTDGNETIETGDGEVILVESIPSYLDHLAICEVGVWDKGGEPAGVQNDVIDSSTEEGRAAMAVNEDAVAADARQDNDDPMTKVMGVLDSIVSRLDCLEAADKARKDAEAKVDRKDGESFGQWAREEEREEAHQQGGDGNDAAQGAQDRKDGEVDERREDARHDSAVARENAELKSRLARLETKLAGVVAETSADERDALARAQARADSVAAMFGDRVNPPAAGETSLSYRKRLLSRFQRHSPRFKDTKLTSVDEATLGVIEDHIYADAQTAARTPAAGAAPGKLVAYEQRDSAGRVITTFGGDPLAWMAPFMTGAQHGRINRSRTH